MFFVVLRDHERIKEIVSVYFEWRKLCALILPLKAVLKKELEFKIKKKVNSSYSFWCLNDAKRKTKIRTIFFYFFIFGVRVRSNF